MRFELPIQEGRGGNVATTASEPEIIVVDNDAFLARVLGHPKNFRYTSRTDVHQVRRERQHGYADWTSMAVTALHDCFDRHVPLSLSPATMWYMIVHEVAEHVKRNGDRYANIFTTTPGEKRTIKSDLGIVHDATPWEWAGVIEKIRRPLREAVTDRTMELFLPGFSNSTSEDEIALLVAFMDTASVYYGYEYVTCCGIPSVSLQGEALDWALLYTQAEELARAFPGLDAYFADLLPVLAKIADTAAGAVVDEHFWTSIYKYGGGSGGPYINGWITAFFAHLNSYKGIQPRTEFGWEKMAKTAFGGFTTDQFPSHVSRVPFVWTHHGVQQPPMAVAAGVFGVDLNNGALEPRLGFAVVEA